MLILIKLPFLHLRDAADYSMSDNIWAKFTSSKDYMLFLPGVLVPL